MTPMRRNRSNTCPDGVRLRNTSTMPNATESLIVIVTGGLFSDPRSCSRMVTLRATSMSLAGVVALQVMINGAPVLFYPARYWPVLVLGRRARGLDCRMAGAGCPRLLLGD